MHRSRNAWRKGLLSGHEDGDVVDAGRIVERKDGMRLIDLLRSGQRQTACHHDGEHRCGEGRCQCKEAYAATTTLRNRSVRSQKVVAVSKELESALPACMNAATSGDRAVQQRVEEERTFFRARTESIINCTGNAVQKKKERKNIN